MGVPLGIGGPAAMACVARAERKRATKLFEEKDISSSVRKIIIHTRVEHSFGGGRVTLTAMYEFATQQIEPKVVPRDIQGRGGSPNHRPSSDQCGGSESSLMTPYPFPTSISSELLPLRGC